MFPEDDLQHIKLNTAFNINILGLSGAKSLRREGVILDAGVVVEYTAKHRILVHVQSHRTIDDVGEVKIHYVVARDNIRVNLDQEVSPRLQQLLFTLERVDLRANDGRTGIECEHVPHERLTLTVHLDYIRNLYNGILLSLREFALLS